MTSVKKTLTPLSRKIFTALRENCLLDPAVPVLLGFSGGADSLCLLGLLAELGWQVTAAHFDHHLRPESGGDAERAGELARRLGVPFILGSGDVARLAHAERLSIEEAARKLRYRFLFATARQLSAQAVCTAHTADDQAETLLLHLVRGAGLAGLRGMQPRICIPDWDAQVPLARPMLGVFREDTRGWCNAKGLSPVEDPSNADRTYTRNRIRHELIPLLESYNPQIRQALARTASALGGDYAVVKAVIEADWNRLLAGASQGWVALDWLGLQALEEGWLRALLRRAVAQLRPGLEDIDLEDIVRAAAFSRQPSASGQSNLTAGLRMFVEESLFYLEEPGAAPLPDRWPQMEPGAEMVIAFPVELHLANGWWIQAERQKIPPWLRLSANENEIWLDTDKLNGPLVVRTGRPGERIRLLGMGGKTQKLSDFWINLRVPRRVRAAFPLVCCGDEVVWVPGLRLAEPFKVSGETQEGLHLVLNKNPA
jgi:tRNA(Ile)-lysidine synthase